MKAAKPKRSSADVQRLDGCEMEMARGASHIASMLYEQSIHAAVSETLLQFEACHGREALDAFAYALLGRLEQRGKPEAVRVLHDFIGHGRLPELTAGRSAIAESGRKRVIPSAQQATPLMTRGLQRLKLFERRRTVWRREASSGAHVGNAS